MFDCHFAKRVTDKCNCISLAFSKKSKVLGFSGDQTKAGFIFFFPLIFSVQICLIKGPSDSFLANYDEYAEKMG